MTVPVFKWMMIPRRVCGPAVHRFACGKINGVPLNYRLNSAVNPPKGHHERRREEEQKEAGLHQQSLEAAWLRLREEHGHALAVNFVDDGGGHLTSLNVLGVRVELLSVHTPTK